MLERKWRAVMTTRTQSAIGKTRKAIKLSKMAFNMVEERAGEITDALMKSALEGKVTSTKLLVELAEGNVDVEDALNKRPFRSLALRLANEPQVPREPLKEAADTEANAKWFAPA
jgi:hypothetical protein